MQHAAHAALQCSVDDLVLLDAGNAAEGFRDDLGGVVVAVTGQVHVIAADGTVLEAYLSRGVMALPFVVGTGADRLYPARNRELALAWGVLTHNLWMLAMLRKVKKKRVALREAA